MFVKVIPNLHRTTFVNIFLIFREFKILKPKWVIEKKRLVNKCQNPHKLLTPQQLFAANNFIWKILFQFDSIFCLNSIAVVTLSKPTHFVVMKRSTMEYLSPWIKSKRLNCRTPCQSKTHLESVATWLRSIMIEGKFSPKVTRACGSMNPQKAKKHMLHHYRLPMKL